LVRRSSPNIERSLGKAEQKERNTEILYSYRKLNRMHFDELGIEFLYTNPVIGRDLELGIKSDYARMLMMTSDREVNKMNGK